MVEAKHMALKMSKEHGLTYINGYDHPNIIAGQGTIGLEICEQVQDVDAVVVPVGGGGLIAGVATAIKAMSPETKIIVMKFYYVTFPMGKRISDQNWRNWKVFIWIQGVESEKCPSFSKALEHGKPVNVSIDPTLADGLAVPMVGFNAFATTVPLLDKMVVVKEEWIALAILRLVEQEKRGIPFDICFCF